MFHATAFIAGEGVQRDSVQTIEDALFYIGIILPQTADELLDLLPLGAAGAAVVHGSVFRKAAGALDKL